MGEIAAATDKSIAAAEHLRDERFAGAIASLRALAEIIDTAKSKGDEAYAKAAFGAIPSYLKACEALLLTPASIQRPGKEATSQDAQVGGKIAKFQDRADARRAAASGGRRGRRKAAAE